MRDPLTHWQHAGRELWCWLVGHRWKSSWHRRADYPERARRADLGLLTYRERQEGNPFFEHSAGWQVKCRRCRRRLRDDPPTRWYVALWRAGAMFGSCWATVISSYQRPRTRPPQGRGYATLPWSWWVANALIGGPLFGFEQAWWCWLHWELGAPSFPGSWASDLHWRWADWVDHRATRYRWFPPDSGDPDELGCHWRTDCLLPDGTRPRIYLRQSGSRTTATTGAHAVPTIRWSWSA